jgi:arabinogalactan oligomer/maltooligosaccharide transport system substrate-binding protein
MLPVQTPTQTLTPTSQPGPTETPVASPTPNPAGTSSTITIWHSWDESQRPALLRRIDAFQQQNPDIQFDVLYIPAIDLRSAYEEAAAEGAGPSILIGPAEWGPELFRAGWVSDLSEMADAQLLDTLNLAALEAGSIGENLIGLPLHLEGVVLYRNSAIISTIPASFDELVNSAQRATRGETVGAVLERSFYYSGGHLYGLGGKLLESPGGGPAFYNPTGVAWLNLLQSFERAGPTEYLTDADLEQFEAGRVGMIIDSTTNRDRLADSLGAGNLHIDPWPIYGDGALSGFIQAENIYLSSAQTGPRLFEDGQQAAWKFIEFFLSPESQNALASVGMIPSLNGAPVVGLLDRIDTQDPLIREAMIAFSGGAAYPINPELAVYTAPMDMALRSVFFQDANPEAALASAYEMVLQGIEEMRAAENQ